MHACQLAEKKNIWSSQLNKNSAEDGVTWCLFDLII